MALSLFLGNLGSLILALLRYNLVLTVVAILVAFPVSSLLALGRLSRHSCTRCPIGGYINLLRCGVGPSDGEFWTYQPFPCWSEARA